MSSASSSPASGPRADLQSAGGEVGERPHHLVSRKEQDKSQELESDVVMATTTLRDLPSSRALDDQALRSIRGGGAEWIFGAFRAFVREVDPILPVVNFNQTNNFFVADQLNVQFQDIAVDNS